MTKKKQKKNNNDEKCKRIILCSINFYVNGSWVSLSVKCNIKLFHK